jgi:hypothetical protein
MTDPDSPLIFYRSGSDILGKNGERANLEKLHSLLQNEVEFVVIRKGDGRDITKAILESIEKRIWTKDEIDMLENEYGKHTLEELRKSFLPYKSTGQIRHKASSLSLTVDKAWQEHEIKALTALRKSGVSFPIISQILERPLHAVQVKANKVGLVYGGRSNENVSSVKRSIEKIVDLPAISKGKIAEDLASIRLIQEGFDVFVPYTPQHKTDTVVIRGDKVAKIQVKSAVWEEKTGRFRVPLKRKHARKQIRSFYDDNDVDFFIFVCLGLNDFYVAPFSLCKLHGEAHLYPHRPRMIQKGFDWEMYRNSFELIDNFLST